MAKMYIQRIHKKTKNKTYTSVVLMENHREGKKVKHHIISNLSKWPDELVEGFDKLLKGERITTISDLQLSQGRSVGAIIAVSEIAKRLGIKQALGNSKQARLAMFQIAGRVISQGSRNYLANEWVKNQAVDEVFKISNFNEDSLYKNLDWISENQDTIEQRLFLYRNGNQKIKEIFLYDVTSSYFEGTKNELADYGYNRDKKKGKKQIVIGLLTDNLGYPISVEVFKGNTGDTQTVSNQLQKLKENFGVERVIFVGDKGMVRSSQIEEITSDSYKWNYLTTITKQQIETLIKKNIIQLELFDNEVIEVESEEGTRYILRRNPERAKELKINRQSKIDYIKEFAQEQSTYLNEHQKAEIDVALIKVEKRIAKFKLQKIVSGKLNGRNVDITIDIKEQEEQEKLDGCYVVKTNVPIKYLNAQTAHDRYKDLSKVEFAFRTMKTTLEKIRPIYVIKKERTKGHVFVAMLAYMIVKYITDTLSELNYTREFIFESLDKINYLEYIFEGK